MWPTLAALATMLLIVLKLGHVVAWPWLVILCPAILTVAWGLALGIVIIIDYAIACAVFGQLW